MRTIFRIVLSVIAGFLLMWPLGYTSGLLNWPTFHSWGLMHGSFVAAWPALSILTFFALGYLRIFVRNGDTPLLIIGLVWGLWLSGFLGISTHLSTSAIYALLIGTTAIVATLSFFAAHKVRLALLVVAPAIFFNLQFLLGLISFWPTGELLLTEMTGALDRIKLPLIFSLGGCAVGSGARAMVKRSAETT